MKTILRTWEAQKIPATVTAKGRAALGIKRLATLTPQEDYEWEQHFSYAIQDLKYGNDRAGQYAWRWLQKIFPRLRSFDGCLP